MPEGHDPYGLQAYNQRIDKELRAAISVHKHQGQIITCDPHGAYIVSNPITHVDRVVEMRNKKKTQMRQAEDNGSEFDGREAQERPGSSRSSVAGSSIPPSLANFPSSASACATASTARDEALANKVEMLEKTLAEERQGRLKVQADLEKLTGLLESHMSKKKKMESGRPPRVLKR